MSCAIRLEGFGFRQEDIDDAVRNRRLLSMEIELGRACNFRCPYCYVVDPKTAPQELGTEELKDAVRQAYELGARKIILLGGEPMLFPGMQEIVTYTSGLGMELEIFTNGTNVTPEMARFFFEHSVKVVIKLNTFDQTLQFKLTGRKWAYDCIHTALKNLMEAGYPTSEKRIAASTIICRQNIAELKELWQWLRDRDVDPYFEMITPQGRSTRNQWLYPDAKDNEKLFFEIAKLDREKYGKNWEPQPPLVGNRCLRNQFTCLVNAYGEVMPCVGITISAGNIRQRTLKDILGASPMFDDLRNFRDRLHGPCAECAKSAECYGCRGAAYQLTGDYLASDPLCWHNKERLDEIVHLPAPAARFAPHQQPMLLLDTLLSVGDGDATAQATIPENGPFIGEDGLLDPAAYLEMLAQTVAVLHGFRSNRRTSKTPCGMLLGARDLIVKGDASAGDVLTVRICHGTSYGEYRILSGTISRGEEVLATGEIKVWQDSSTDTNPESRLKSDQFKHPTTGETV